MPVHQFDYVHEDKDGNEKTYSVEFTSSVGNSDLNQSGLPINFEVLSIKHNGVEIAVDEDTMGKIFDEIEEQDIDAPEFYGDDE